MTHWKLTLAYDGTPFHGWQVQPGLPTVQGLLADAIHRTAGERVLPQGSGRTDAGVHALAQVASFALAAPVPATNLQRALNRCLPPSIRVLSAEIAPPDFHARHSAVGKTYEYRIFPLRASTHSGAPHLDSEMCGDNICPPTLAPFVWPCPWPLDLDALNQAARHVIGTHDFTSFAASDPDLTARTLAESGAPHLDSEMWDEAPKEAVIPAEAGHGLTGSTEGEDQPHTQRDCHSDPEHREGEESPHFATADPDRPESGAPHLDSEMWDANATKTPIRTITHSCWHIENGLFLYRVAADGFLHHMVRNLVGTFVQAGAHRLAPASIPAILAARNRSAAGPTAPASGLFLVSVNYRAATNNQQPTTNNSL